MAEAADWLSNWMAGVVSGKATMSQRKLSSVEAHGGVKAAVAAAKAAGVHLVQLTDDKGEMLIAASREPFKTHC